MIKFNRILSIVYLLLFMIVVGVIFSAWGYFIGFNNDLMFIIFIITILLVVFIQRKELKKLRGDRFNQNNKKHDDH